MPEYTLEMSEDVERLLKEQAERSKTPDLMENIRKALALRDALWRASDDPVGGNVSVDRKDGTRRSVKLI